MEDSHYTVVQVRHQQDVVVRSQETEGTRYGFRQLSFQLRELGRVREERGSFPSSCSLTGSAGSPERHASRLKQTDSSLLDHLDDVAGTDGQRGVALCHAMNRTRHSIEGMIRRVSLYSHHFMISPFPNVVTRNTHICRIVEA
jgi:hypothetical protein